jgi:NADPH-dependent curcumin reductase CurA
MMMSREIRLASRPAGWPTAENFALASVEVLDPGEGQVQVRNKFLSVDPYMRGRMNDTKSYIPPFAVGAALDGGAVGEVIASRAPGFAAGDLVFSMRGWREAFTAPSSELRKLDALPGVAPSAYLGVLGVPGLTAWVGLGLADVKAGDRVFISAAAGATGSIAGQIAKLRGCRVVGSAGGAAKVEIVKGELGFDAAFDYKQGDLVAQLKAAAPDGLDVYFDNVGGAHLEAAIGAMRNNGRIILCGAISQYNAQTPAPGPRNLEVQMVAKRLSMRGFIVSDHMGKTPEFVREVGGYLAAGKLVTRETVVDGVERTPAAFLELLRGENIGKMIVRV